MSVALAEPQVKEHQVVACPKGFVVFPRACGEWQGASVDCGDLLCPRCQRRWANEARARWYEFIRGMREPRMLTLTVRSGFDLAEREAFERASFRRLLSVRMGARNWPRFKAEALEFLGAHLDAHEADEDKRVKRYGVQARSLERLGRRISKLYAEHGEWPRVRDLLRVGLSSPEVTYRDEHGWHVHRHVIYDGERAPWALWCVLWRHATKGEAFVVDIRYKKPRDDDEAHEVACELIKYISKPGSVPAELADEFRAVFRHRKKLWRIGKPEPSEPEPKPCPFCGSLECSIETWNVQVGELIYFDGKEAHVQLPEGVKFMRLVDGCWREWWSLHLPGSQSAFSSNIKALKSHTRARDGPKEPSGGFDETLLEDAFGSKHHRWLS